MPADQARALTIALLATLPLALTACEGTGPIATLGRVFGPATEGRERPPGLDGGEYPPLGTVPPRPDRPTPQSRQALTDQLARERALSRDELPVTAMSSGRLPAPTRELPGPPPSARVGPMVAVPPVPSFGIPATPAVAPVPQPAVPPSTPRTAVPAPEPAPAPGQAPALGGPPPLPSSDLLGPGSGSGPPPLPSQDLLGPGGAPPARP
ncbi:MAG TPA: hypothetical protein VGM87_01300 [Roseomonas sp.]|jgi:hypothetical protein